MPVLTYSRAFTKDVVSKGRLQAVKYVYHYWIFLAVNKCCPAEHMSCCMERVFSDSFLPCDSNEKNWESTAACLEHEFHNTSLIESNGTNISTFFSPF